MRHPVVEVAGQLHPLSPWKMAAEDHALGGISDAVDAVDLGADLQNEIIARTEQRAF